MELRNKTNNILKLSGWVVGGGGWKIQGKPQLFTNHETIIWIFITYDVKKTKTKQNKTKNIPTDKPPYPTGNTVAK